MEWRIHKPNKKMLFFALSPGILIYSFIIVFPLLFSVFYSFYDWNGGDDLNFVGIGNYLLMLRDSDFLLSFRNTAVITLLNVVGQVGIGLVVAVILTREYVKLPGLHRTLIFMPVIISPVVTGLIWSIVYNNRNGLLNLALRSLGLGSLIQLWLDNPDIVLGSISVAVIWQYIGLYMVILLGALENIPQSVIESSMIDGASPFQQAVKIMIPMIYPTLKVAIMICLAGTLKIFDHIFVMTGGGPGKSSMTMTQYDYNISFNMLRLSYGSTLSIGIIVIIFVITGATLKVMGGKRYE